MASKTVGAATAAGRLRWRRARAAAGAGALALAVLGLDACSETSLSDAPVIDLSTPAGARSSHAKPPALPIAAQPGEALYTVERGDTLYHLAANAHCSIEDLASWNGIDAHAPIFVGQQLRLHAPGAVAADAASGAVAPVAATDADSSAAAEVVATPIAQVGSSAYETRTLEAPLAPVPNTAAAPAPAPTPSTAAVVAPGAGAAGGAGAAAAPPPSVQPAAPVAASGADAAPGAGVPASGALAAPPVVVAAPAPAIGTSVAPPAAAGNADAATAGWIWPVDGPVTGKFDPLRGKGIEIAAAEDAPVVAVADGTVSYTGSPRDYGNLIIIKHSDELLSVYAHNKTLLVKEGETVRRGQAIATAGKTANVPSTLHFEVRRNHVAIDPLDVLPLR